jgi:hypothetical protein
MSGIPEKGQGYTRYQTMSDLFAWNFLAKNLSVDLIVQEAMTCLKHSLTGIDLGRLELPAQAEQRTMVSFADFVPRYSTTASLIVQGVHKGEDPSLTTLWLVLGNPLVTPILPVFVAAADRIPAMMFSRDGKPALLNDKSLRLKGRCFPVKTPEARYYVDLARLLNKEGTGTLQVLRRTNRSLLEKGRGLLEESRNRGLAKENLVSFYAWAENTIREYYRLFGIE